ncbi:hypothetical protein [Actinomadura logoneensis]|uniref:hypothetical protein n=1 Tax=Actinomadura logoneensis TaxID=2293572 RepID=UPI0018F218CA|nr:hypothetical protein [Actinomadura logoneensis]
MTRIFGSVSDKLLGAVLGEKAAGACIPENGQLCYCKGGYRYTFNCYGVCTKQSTRC